MVGDLDLKSVRPWAAEFVPSLNRGSESALCGVGALCGDGRDPFSLGCEPADDVGEASAVAADQAHAPLGLDGNDLAEWEGRREVEYECVGGWADSEPAAPRVLE